MELTQGRAQLDTLYCEPRVLDPHPTHVSGRNTNDFKTSNVKGKFETLALTNYCDPHVRLALLGNLAASLACHPLSLTPSAPFLIVIHSLRPIPDRHSLTPSSFCRSLTHSSSSETPHLRYSLRCSSSPLSLKSLRSPFSK